MKYRELIKESARLKQIVMNTRIEYGTGSAEYAKALSNFSAVQKQLLWVEASLAQSLRPTGNYNLS